MFEDALNETCLVVAPKLAVFSLCDEGDGRTRICEGELHRRELHPMTEYHEAVCRPIEFVTLPVSPKQCLTLYLLYR